MEIKYVILILYVLLIIFDLITLIRERDKKVLFLSIPVYVFTFVALILANLGADLSYVNAFIVDIVNSIFHIAE